MNSNQCAPTIPKYPRMDKQNHLLLTYPSSLIAAIASVFFAEHSLVTQRNPLHFLPVSSFTCAVMAKIIVAYVLQFCHKKYSEVNVKAMKWCYIQLIMVYIHKYKHQYFYMQNHVQKHSKKHTILTVFPVYKCNLILHIKIEMLHLTIPPQPRPWCDVFFRLLFGMLFFFDLATQSSLSTLKHWEHPRINAWTQGAKSFRSNSSVLDESTTSQHTTQVSKCFGKKTV